MSAVTQRYNVGGIYLQRPFKIRRLGHFGFNVEKLPEGREFYSDLLGFTASDTLDFNHIGAEPSQHLGARGAGLVVREVDHANTL